MSFELQKDRVKAQRECNKEAKWTRGNWHNMKKRRERMSTVASETEVNKMPAKYNRVYDSPYKCHGTGNSGKTKLVGRVSERNLGLSSHVATVLSSQRAAQEVKYAELE